MLPILPAPLVMITLLFSNFFINYLYFTKIALLVRVYVTLFYIIVASFIIVECGWGKLNVVFLGRQVCWQNTSFNFAKDWFWPFILPLVYCR